MTGLPTSGPNAEPSGRLRLVGREVLLVDDHELLRMGVDLMLRSTFAHWHVGKVHHARTLAEGVACYALHREDIGLVVLDLHLPDAHGLHGLERFMRCFPNAPVVVLSGENEPQLAERAVRSGAMAFWPKSGDMNEIREQLQQLHNTQGSDQAPVPEQSPQRQAMGHDAQGSPVMLSPKQLQILYALLGGMTNRDIAQHVYLSEGTIKNHVSALLQLYGVDSRAQLLALLR